MYDDIFTPGEGFSQYNKEQLELLKKITQIERQKSKETTQELSENLTKDKQEDDEKYLLGLA